MKTLFLCIAFSSLVLTLVQTESNAKPSDFSCETRKGIPVTIAITEKGSKVLVRWQSRRMAGNLTPQQRCERVAEKLQAAQDNTLISHLVARKINGQEVICFSDKKDGDCIDTFITLKPGSSAKKALGEILDLRGLANGKAIEEGEGKKVSLDFLKYLERTPIEKNEQIKS
jgi:hypothetical protein